MVRPELRGGEGMDRGEKARGQMPLPAVDGWERPSGGPPWPRAGNQEAPAQMGKTKDRRAQGLEEGGVQSCSVATGEGQ